ncbi:hypothetical protein Tco_0462239 [Tanacetum coccineum]
MEALIGACGNGPGVSSKRKFGIVCHKKVVRIPLEGNEILRVHGERNQGVVKTLMNTKFWSDASRESPIVLRNLGNAKNCLGTTSRVQDEELELLRKEKLFAKKWRVKLRRVRAMSMTIQSSVKDKILATLSKTSKVENTPAKMLRDLDQQMEKRVDDANVVSNALSRKERVKSRRVRGMILVLLVGSVMDGAHASRYLVHPGANKTYYNLGDMYCLSYLSENEIESPWNLSLNFQGQSNNSKEWNSGDDQLRLRWMIYLVVLADAAERTLEDIMRAGVIDFGGSYHLSIRCAPFKALYRRKCRSPILWAEIGESSLTGLELVQETIDKVVLVKEKPKAARDRQKSYIDYRRKPLEFEVGDRVLLRVSPWKGVVRFGKKGKLAPRYVEPFKILKRIGLVAYRLRLLKELNSVHDTFHVSNLKKCLADASLHVPLDEIKVDKTLRFVKEPVEIMDREIKKLKRRKIALVKVRWNSKRGPDFTWEYKDRMRIKYLQLFVDRVVKPAS